MLFYRAYVVRLFDDVFSGNETNRTHYASSDYSSNNDNNNMTNKNGASTECLDSATTFEAYMSAVTVAIVRLASSLLLSRLLMRERFIFFQSEKGHSFLE